MKSKILASMYFYDDAGKGSGRVRQLTTTGFTPSMDLQPIINDLLPDPVAFYFYGNVNKKRVRRVMVVERVFEDACYITVYDPKDWSEKVPRQNYSYKDGSKVKNIYNIISLPETGEGNVYGVDYSSARAFKLHHKVENGAEMLSFEETYVFKEEANFKMYPVDICIDSSFNIYVVAQQYFYDTAANIYHYRPSKIVKLDPTDISKVLAGPKDVAPNAFDIQPFGEAIYVTAIGGQQWYGEGEEIPNRVKWNEASRIQKVDTVNLNATDLIRPATYEEVIAAKENDAIKKIENDMFDIRALAILEDGAAYILTGDYITAKLPDDKIGYRFNGRVWKANIEELSEANNIKLSELDGAKCLEKIFFKGEEGYLWSLLPINDGNSAWLVKGNKIAVLKEEAILGEALDVNRIWPKAFYNMISLALPEEIGESRNRVVRSAIRGFTDPSLAGGGYKIPEETKRILN